jgi:hypothetical protein
MKYILYCIVEGNVYFLVYLDLIFYYYFVFAVGCDLVPCYLTHKRAHCTSPG